MNTKLKSQIMHRVYMVTYLRRALSPFALKSYAALALLWGVGRVVWVARVIENAPGLTRPFDNIHFFTSAFAHTHLIVQVLVLGVTVFCLWLMRDLTSPRRNQYLLASF